jgi:3-methyladenine DNA glycosylase AlkD
MVFNAIKEKFEQHRNEANAGPMKKYMKELFPFLGIKTPARNQLMRGIYNDTRILKQDFNPELVSLLWKQDEREYQYAALDYIGRMQKKLDIKDFTLMEELITTKSWWDTVDMLAANPIGKIATDHSEVIQDKIDGWNQSENIWLVRTSILFQLKFKERTDTQLLYRYISNNAESKEFFIRKVIGWALREYSKTNPDSVREFITKQPLSNLSVREASKYLY